MSELNYVIATPGRRKSTQLCHVNLLKPYYSRDAEVSLADKEKVRPALMVNSVSGSQEEDGVPEPDDSR
ncbi:hypothetical protein F2P79_008498 [Pimephales promelas]|nr:hypothetical protein F2P79_008498 [Pimephales promelas]